MISKIYLFALNIKKHVFNELINVVHLLHENGFEVLAEEWIRHFISKEKKTPLDTNPEHADIIISLGGDGTLLRAAQLALRYDKPLLGMNAGRLGFLTEFNLEELHNNISKIQMESFAIEERSLISLTVNSQDLHVVNDVVISRGGYSRLVNYDVYCDGQFVSSYFADGIIVSTPTGSTGYSLSAGGPIMMPDVESMIITPICAHSLLHRSIVVSNNRKVEIRLKNDTDLQSQLVLDGVTVKNLSKNETITLYKSERKLKLIRLTNMSFFEIVQKKLADWK